MRFAPKSDVTNLRSFESSSDLTRCVAKLVRTAKTVEIICSELVWPAPVRFRAQFGPFAHGLSAFSADLAHSPLIGLLSARAEGCLRSTPLRPPASVPLRSGTPRPSLRSGQLAPFWPNQLRTGQTVCELAKLCLNLPYAGQTSSEPLNLFFFGRN